jgi:exonuclease SbcD
MKFVHTADTHLGYEVLKTGASDLEGRKRRSDAIFDNFVCVAKHAIDVEADLFIHSGDLFNKYYIPRERLDELIRPVLEVAAAGIPVLIIPGNHERSQFPFDLFHGAKDIFVFDRPKTLCFTLDGYKVAFAGFPFIREDSRRTFLQALAESEYDSVGADFNILVTHQAFDEATVGPADYTFTARRSDTVVRETIPEDFEYIAAGHIHRYQILEHPLKPRLKFVYPGSIQRVNFAEVDEEKGFVVGEVLHDRIETHFIPLAAWDMEIVEIDAGGRRTGEVEEEIRSQFWRFREDMVIRFRLTGGEGSEDYSGIDFQEIRAEMPPVLECQFMLKIKKRWVLR